MRQSTELTGGMTTEGHAVKNEIVRKKKNTETQLTAPESEETGLVLFRT